MLSRNAAEAKELRVIGNQIIMGDLMARLSVVPELAHVLNQLARVIDQRVVNRHHPTGRVARL